MKTCSNKEFPIFVLICLLVSFSCIGCTSQAPISSKTRTELSIESVANNDTVKKIQDEINSALSDYDVSVHVLDNNGISASIYLNGGVSISSYAFAYIVKQSVNTIKSVISDYEEPINKIEFYGIGDTRILQWETTDLQKGIFMDLPEPSTKLPSVARTMTIDEVLEYCGYSE